MRRLQTSAIICVAALLLPIGPAAGQELPPGGTFTDDDGSVHEPAIEALVAAEITFGCETDLFCPDDPVTRGQMASFLARALPDLDPATTDWFTDDDGSVHEPDINIIAENRITLGYTDGTFRPDQPIKRAEMASMLVRALDLAPIVPPPRYRTVAIYLYLDSLGDDPLGPGPFLVPVARTLAWSTTPATDTMAALLAGSVGGKIITIPAISTEIPPEVSVTSITVADGTAHLDLAGFLSPNARAVAQIVFTLTQFPTVDRVEISVDSVPLDEVSGIGAPFERTDFLDAGVLPLVFVDLPLHGGTADNPVRLVGRTAAFEAQFMITIVDADGLILREVPVLANGEQTVSGDGVPWTSFDVTIPYPLDSAQRGAIIAFDTSAQDGRQIGVREYPVTLEAGDLIP